jgi:6,7-dimethyl-8-ribityllumazine synthase
MKIAIVASRFNEELTKRLFEGAYAVLLEKGLQASDIDAVWVPGAIEIPIIAQELGKQKIFDAIICLGAVVRGDTDHYDYVCQQVSWGCQKVALKLNIPVIFGILTVDNWTQALDRLGGTHGHKGCDAAETAISMVQLMQELRNYPL